MRESLRFEIPVPCSEDWDKMEKAEQGRHCQQCCKTVVDFTVMTDEEVFTYFKKLARSDSNGAGMTGQVCGRFMADQLSREFRPLPVQRNGWSGWKWMLASTLVLSKPPEGRRMAPPLVQARHNPWVPGSEPPIGHEVTVLMGEPAKPVVTGTTVRIEKDDTVKTLAADTVVGWETKRKTDITGDVMVIGDTVLCTRKEATTVSKVISVVDTVVDILKDTIATVVTNFRREEAVSVYPNPVLRGGQVHLAWQGSPGRLQVTLIAADGAIVQDRMIEVLAKGQVDEWPLPAGLAAGVYFIRVSVAGEPANTTEVLVQ